MLYYADKLRQLDLRDTTERVSETLLEVAEGYSRQPASPYSAALQSHSALIGAAISLGELHQAVSDQRNPTVDDVFPEVDRLTSAALLVGRCVYRSALVLRRRAGVYPLPPGAAREPRSTAPGPAPHRSDSVASESAPDESTEIAARMPELLYSSSRAMVEAASTLPSGRLEARVPEGYAFYCLYPEMYLASLMKAHREEPFNGLCTVVGIRSIGTSLATLVAGALLEMGVRARVETVRPRGHPFDRYVEVASSLRERLAAELHGGARFILVDEGPGLTCSSFLSACSALSKLGAEEERLTIFCAWRGAPSIYGSDDGRARWGRLRRFHTDAAEAFDGWRAFVPFVRQALASEETEDDPSFGSPAIQDLSYGRWREHYFPSPALWPVVHRASERTKVLYRFPTISLLAKFAGLGHYGQEKWDRATALADAGFAPPVVGLAYGFLLSRFMEDARPMVAADLTPSLLARMVEYYAFVAHRFSEPPAPRFRTLAEMVLVNARESLGLDAAPFVASWSPRQGEIDRLPLARIDGRPQPWEWLRVSTGGDPLFLKADSSDHFSDHTLVGLQSVLWDLAGASEEWEMSAGAGHTLMDLWERTTGDRQAATLLGFYRAAYLAFRVAGLHYAVHSTNEEEIRKSLQHEEWKYRQRLVALLTLHTPG